MNYVKEKYLPIVFVEMEKCETNFLSCRSKVPLMHAARAMKLRHKMDVGQKLGHCHKKVGTFKI